MFLSLNNLYQTHVPRLINVRVTGFTKSVYELEKDTGLILDTSDILKEIVDCLKDRVTATVELEMYCLSMMEKQCHSGIEDEIKQIIKLFVQTGNTVYQELVEHGLYKDNRLDFLYSNSIMDNLIFVEKGSMVRVLNEEFNIKSRQYPRFVDGVW